MGMYLSPFWFGDPKSVWGLFVIRIPILVWGSPFWFGDLQTDMGIPKLKWVLDSGNAKVIA